jgi:hypothetical protein
MPCANYIMMGSATNSILTPNHSATYGIMNKFVTLKSKRQHTSSSFILQFNFNKIESITFMCPYFNHETPWRIDLPWAMHSLTQSGLGRSFPKCPLLSQLKHLTLDRSYFTFLISDSLFVDFSLSFWNHDLPWPHCCGPCSHCLGLDFSKWPTYGFTLVACRSFILHTFHHLQ